VLQTKYSFSTGYFHIKYTIQKDALKTVLETAKHQDSESK